MNGNTNVCIAVQELKYLFEKFNITSNKNDIKQLIREYFQLNPEFKNHKSVILQELKKFIIST